MTVSGGSRQFGPSKSSKSSPVRYLAAQCRIGTVRGASCLSRGPNLHCEFSPNISLAQPRDARHLDTSGQEAAGGLRIDPSAGSIIRAESSHESPRPPWTRVPSLISWPHRDVRTQSSRIGRESPPRPRILETETPARTTSTIPRSEAHHPGGHPPHDPPQGVTVAGPSAGPDLCARFSGPQTTKAVAHASRDGLGQATTRRADEPCQARQWPGSPRQEVIQEQERRRRPRRRGGEGPPGEPDDGVLAAPAAPAPARRRPQWTCRVPPRSKRPRQR